MGKFLRKLSLLIRRKQFIAELSEEMIFHREQSEREFRAGGMSPQAARHAAMRQFGNATRITERSHEMVGWW